ncbi:DUF6188 family protein [Nocardiopsis sp. RV163]|uniref:DUF6188 family protein n=1 Tax=Nocardiopsis sp. RV163 TaxID=1661388 RepID=UPI001F1A5985|nr:DUF6188 family protein [Nocardiopsis sp. RV163]
MELIGTQVTRTAFDHQVGITFTGHGPGGRVRLDGELAIETTLSLTDAGGRQVALTPGTGTCLAPLLGLFARTVAGVGITGRRTLRLVFDDGTWLSAVPDPDYESWGLTGVGPDPVLVGPGGEAD